MPSTAGPFATLVSAGGLPLRRFGSRASDLAVDTHLPEPFAVTAVLAACTIRGPGEEPDEAPWWAMSVGRRLACLVVLAGAETRDELDFFVSCPQPCAELLATSITVDEVLGVASRAADAPLRWDGDGLALTLRPPTGADQARWFAAEFADAETARRAILRELVMEGAATDLSALFVSEIEEVLDESDPLVRCTVDVRCPLCGARSSHDLPLAETALGNLRQVQAEMARAVHSFASCYGWSETEILSLPPWRRDLYLSLIDQTRR